MNRSSNTSAAQARRVKNTRENYDPNAPVCNTQNDFNQAFSSAIDYTNQQQAKSGFGWNVAYIILWLICMVWGVLIAMQIPSGPERVEHVLFAIVAGPAYILAHYVAKFGKSGTARMSMGGGGDMGNMSCGMGMGASTARMECGCGMAPPLM